MDHFYRFLSRCTKGLYKSYVALEASIGKKSTVIGIIALILVSFLARKILPLQISSAEIWIPLAVFIVTFLAYLLTGLSVRRLVKNTSGQYLFNTDTYLKIYDGKIVQIENLEENASFKKCGKKNGDLNAISELDYRAFSGTAWYEPLEEKEKRNLSCIERNDNSFFSIMTRDGKTLVGFTHVFPVNFYTWSKYKEGLLGTNEFPASFVIPRQACLQDDLPFGLVVFSAIIQGQNPDYANDPKYKEKNGDLLTKAILWHIRSFFGTEFKNQRVIPVMFETMSGDLIRRMKKYAVIKKNYSKDGARLICFEVINESAGCSATVPQEAVK